MSIAQTARADVARRERATRGAQNATLLGVLVLLAALACGRMVTSAFGYGVPAWFDEELNPLINLLTSGEPITQIDPRQYGVVVFLVFDPAVRRVGGDLAALATYATWVSLAAVTVAWVLCAVRFALSDHTEDGRSRAWSRALVLAIAWASAVPLLYVVAQHMVDAWQLLFVSLALFLWTSGPRQQKWAALPLAAATLTKLLPAVLLVYIGLRSWRAGLVGVLGIAGLLAIGQALYGTLMGFGYPVAMLLGGGSTVGRWSAHFENNSLRGLVYKIAAGFHLQGDTASYVLDPSRAPFLNLLSYALELGVLGYLVWAAWRGRHVQSLSRRAIEFSLAIVTMLLASPHTAQDYLVMTLPVLTVWLYLWARRLPRPWTVAETALGGVAAVLLGVFVPMNLVARVLPSAALLAASGNAQNALFADQIGSAIGIYQFFGFAGLGLILGWLLLVRLERASL